MFPSAYLDIKSAINFGFFILENLIWKEWILSLELWKRDILFARVTKKKKNQWQITEKGMKIGQNVLLKYEKEGLDLTRINHFFQPRIKIDSEEENIPFA